MSTFKKLFEGVEGVTVKTIKAPDPVRHGPGPADLASLIDEAERKAIDSLSRYKFAMFGYWAGIWVHLNRIEGKKRASPFKRLVKIARLMQKISDED